MNKSKTAVWWCSLIFAKLNGTCVLSNVCVWINILNHCYQFLLIFSFIFNFSNLNQFYCISYFTLWSMLASFYLLMLLQILIFVQFWVLFQVIFDNFYVSHSFVSKLIYIYYILYILTLLTGCFSSCLYFY